MKTRFFSSLIVLLAVVVAISAPLAPIFAEETTSTTSATSNVSATDSTATTTVTTTPSESASLSAEPVESVDTSATVEVMGSSTLPATVQLKTNKGLETVFLPKSALLGSSKSKQISLDNWLPTDKVRVVGKRNLNTGLIEATKIVPEIDLKKIAVINGWITKIDQSASTFTLTWNKKEKTYKVSSGTKIISGNNTSAALSDLKIGDRVRGRVAKGTGTQETPDAKILVVLRTKGEAVSPTTWIGRMELSEIPASTVVPSALKMKVLSQVNYKGHDADSPLKTGDVKSVNITDKTELRRKFWGGATLDEFMIGDNLMVVLEIKDNAYEAKLVKNNDIYQVGTGLISGEITEIDASRQNFKLLWNGKPYRVDVSSSTKIINASDSSAASFSNLAIGTKIQGRGVKHKNFPIIQAKVIRIVTQ